MAGETDTLPEVRDRPIPVDASMASVVKELERHGYVAGPHLDGSGGAICRHPAAPTLFVRDNGRIELLGGPAATQAAPHAQGPRTRVRWGRSVVFLAMLGAAVFLGLLVVAMIVG